MVTVICTPSQSEFRKVTGPDYNTAMLACKIHKNLGTFAGLTVLIGQIMYGLILTDIGKMLPGGLYNGYFFGCDADEVHQGL